MKATFPFLLLPLLALTTDACYKKLDCSGIKNGKFYYYTKHDRSKIFVERKDSLQWELDTKDSSISKSRIVWRNNCSYDLYLNALSDTKLGEIDSVFSTIPANVTIIQVNSDNYVCDLSMNLPEKSIKMRDTIFFNNE